MIFKKDRVPNGKKFTCSWTKALLAVFFVLLLARWHFSWHYACLRRGEIREELMKGISTLDVDFALDPCDYGDILANDTVLAIPDPLNRAPPCDGAGLESGQYVPPACRPLYSTAILVPYRNRQSQLDVFLPYIHNFLRRQNIHYRVFIVEQGGAAPWNKGKLFNAGAKVAMELGFPCLVLHDVDMLPLNPSNLYACTGHPRHMSASVDKFRYHLPYDSLIGGALAMLSVHYKKINGFSNKFEMWGGEDDDLYNRIINEKLTVQRFPPDMSMYTMMKHKHEPFNENRHAILDENFGKHKDDGLSTLSYKHMVLSQHPLYTNITVEI